MAQPALDALEALQSQLGEANDLKEFYKDLSDTAQQRIADNILHISIKLKDSEEREAGLSDQLLDLQKAGYKLETAHSIDLIKRRIELQCTKHPLKKAQAKLVLLEGKEAMTKEDVVLFERVVQETQDMYEREVEHGNTGKKFCRSRDTQLSK